MTQQQDIIKSLLMVKVTVHGWGGGTIDREAASEYARSKHAEESRYSVYVQFLPDDLCEIMAKAASAISGVWKSRTLPFKDGGWRVLLAEQYLDLFEALRDPKEAYMAAAGKLLAQYDSIRAQAEAALNGGFKPELFPSREQLEGKYGVDIRSEPVLTSNDVRVQGLTDAAAEMVKQSVEAQVKESLGTAVQSIGDSLLTIVLSFREKLKEAKSKSGKKRIVWGKLENSAERICTGLDSLVAITGNAKDREIVQRVRTLVCEAEFDPVGWSGTIVATQAESLADEIAEAFILQKGA